MPLPDVLPLLAANGVRFRRGQMTMIVAQPNGGKSLFAMFQAIKMGVPCLYISADTDEATMRLRAAACLMQKEIREVEEMMQTSASFLVDEAMEQMDEYLFWSYNPNPSMSDLEDEILATEEVLGEFPHVIVVDNLMNLAHGSDAEWQEMRSAMAAFHTLARLTDSSVWILHHVSESDSRAFMPAPRKAIQGKVAQLPEQILSVAMNPQENAFRVASVKNRHAAHDPTGETHVALAVDAARMSIYDSQHEMRLAQTRMEFA